jgi:hypothetical protein
MEPAQENSHEEREKEAARQATREMRSAILIIGLSLVFVCVAVVVIFLVGHFRIN